MTASPSDLVPMGVVLGAFGVRGWVRVKADTEYPDSLLDYSTWWLQAPDGAWHDYALQDAEMNVKGVVAKLAGCDDRESAHALRGQTVAVSRALFPEAGPDSYYWSDLQGLAVLNLAGEHLGEVSHLFETAANDVLVVRDASGVERMLPFVASVVLEVDLPNRTIRVDWGLDY